MFKIIGALLIISASSIAGFFQSEKLNKRVSFLEQYINFINDINTQIRFTMQPIENIIKTCASSEIFKEFITAINKKINKNVAFNKAWESSIEILRDEFCLKENEINLVKKFGEKLGCSDICGQQAHCKMNLNFAKEALKAAKDEKNKKGKLYKVLGVSAGVCIALIII